MDISLRRRLVRVTVFREGAETVRNLRRNGSPSPTRTSEDLEQFAESRRGNVSKRHPSNLMTKHLLALLFDSAVVRADAGATGGARGLGCESYIPGEIRGSPGRCPIAANGQSCAIVKGSRIQNGTIEVELAGKPAEMQAPERAGSSGWRSGCKGTSAGIPIRTNFFREIMLKP